VVVPHEGRAMELGRSRGHRPVLRITLRHGPRSSRRTRCAARPLRWGRRYLSRGCGHQDWWASSLRGAPGARDADGAGGSPVESALSGRRRETRPGRVQYGAGRDRRAWRTGTAIARSTDQEGVCRGRRHPHTTCGGWRSTGSSPASRRATTTTPSSTSASSRSSGTACGSWPAARKRSPSPGTTRSSRSAPRAS
jgi:hypothetical protein